MKKSNCLFLLLLQVLLRLWANSNKKIETGPRFPKNQRCVFNNFPPRKLKRFLFRHCLFFPSYYSMMKYIPPQSEISVLNGFFQTDNITIDKSFNLIEFWTNCLIFRSIFQKTAALHFWRPFCRWEIKRCVIIQKFTNSFHRHAWPRFRPLLWAQFWIFPVIRGEISVPRLIFLANCNPPSRLELRALLKARDIFTGFPKFISCDFP